MKNLILLTAIILLGANTRSAESSLEGGLEQLRPFLGTWRGEFKNSTPERPIVDIAQWERALNGKAIRVLHSINNGTYGGEVLILWDAKEEKLVSRYFTTADFQTTGTIQLKGKSFLSHEKVVGNPDSTTEVRATIEFRDDGSFVSKAEFLKNGSWEPGHEITYRRAPDAKVVFK